MIQATRNATCLISPTGGLKCFGYNGDGELGDGTKTDRPTPVDVVGLGSGVVMVASTQGSKCAVTTVGAVKCWGSNLAGRLGDGTIIDRLTPVDVVGLGSGVMQISGGFSHMCALTTAGGVKCWGANFRNELGNGLTTESSIPVDVTGLSSGVSQIASGGDHVCALLTTGGVKCWGYNSNGQQGDGTLVNHPTPADVPGLTSGVVGITAGVSHTCAVLATGAVKCWGFNLFGQVGDGSFTQRTTPTQVSGLTSGYVAVIGGANISCAMSATGAVKCWGNGGSSNGIGSGSTSDSAVPVDVVGINGGNHLLSGFNPPGPPSLPMTKGVGESLTLSATSSAGLPVTYSTYTPDRCTVAGNQVQFIAMGLCFVRADSAGSGATTAAPSLTRLIVVGAAGPAITITPPALPAGTVGTPYSQPLTASNGAAPYVFTVPPGTLPPGLSLSASGLISGTPTTNGSYPFTVTATDTSSATGTQAYTVAIGVVTRTLTVTRSGTGTGSVTSTPAGISCGATCAADFADGLVVALAPAADPGSSFVNWTGACSGSGACNVTMSAAQSVAAVFNLAAVVTPLAFPPAMLPVGTVGGGYSAALAATGGTVPYTFSVTGGTLPPGVILDPATGALSGNPTQTGTFNFQATVRDATNATAAQAFSILVIAPGALIPIPTLSMPALLALMLLALGSGIVALRRKAPAPVRRYVTNGHDYDADPEMDP